jgi:hypothetical protein
MAQVARLRLLASRLLGGALGGRVVPPPAPSAPAPREAFAETDVVEAPGACDQDCVICLSAIEGQCVRTPCGHIFHEECLGAYLLSHHQQQSCQCGSRRPRCPVCRGSLRQPFPVEARSSSGLHIEVTTVPEVGEFCHVDRPYSFRSLGDFQRPGMLYVLTSNEDRRTPASEVMWVLDASVHVTLHLNFRSDDHVTKTGAEDWLREQGWELNTALRSTVSTGIPNGPYTGPVYSRACAPGRIDLMGSNTWEGVYFVFIEVTDDSSPPQPQRSSIGSVTSPSL